MRAGDESNREKWMDKRLDLELPAIQEGAAHAAGPDTPIAIDIEADPTLGYASLENSVPVVRALRLTNRSSQTFEAVELRVSCNPAFAQGVTLRFDRLQPGETRRNAPLDLTPDHA